MTNEKVVYLHDDESSMSNVQRFYLFDSRRGEYIQSVVDVNSLLDLFNEKDIELSDDCLSKLDKVLCAAADDCFENGKIDLTVNQLLTVCALYCSNSPLYKDFRLLHPKPFSSFSYFLSIMVDENGELVVLEKLLLLDRLITGDLLDDIYDGMFKEYQLSRPTKAACKSAH